MANPVNSYDVIVIGGGHNGLVCAAYLAKAGRRVLVLESRHVLGGAAVTEELYPGFKYSVCSYVVSLLRPQIIRDLELPRFGLSIIPLKCSFSPLPDGDSLARWDDPERTRREIARFSQTDAERYPEFGRSLLHISRFVRGLLEVTPPDPASKNPTDLLELLKIGRRVRDLGSEDFVRLTKLMTMSSSDLLDEWFESDVLKAPMSVSGIIGTFLGVRSPGTAYVMLHHYMGEIDGAFRSWGFSRGGTGMISQSIADAARHFGAEIRTEASVEKILIHRGVATGVVLTGGEEIQAKMVVSCLDPNRTFLGLVDSEHMDSEFIGKLKNYRLRGSSGKVNLALDGLPEFKCRPGKGPHLEGDIAIAPSVDYLERAYDEAKYGEFSKRPYLNVVIPSTVDPTLAPPGKHVMSIFVQYAPYHLSEGAAQWPSKRDAFGDTVIDTLAEYMPNLKNLILHRQVLSPWDLEQEFGLTEGNIFHGELGLEQLFYLRPVASWAKYRSPIRKLWMCGSGTHPGGGIMGASGANAARDMLKAGVV